MDEDLQDDHPWASIYNTCRDAFYGSVNTLEEAMFLVREFGYHTNTSYVITKSSKNFGKGNLTDDDTKTHSIRWTDDKKIKHGTELDLNGTPFIIIGSRMMDCHQGPDYHKKKSESKSDSSDHQYQQAAHKKKNTGTKKKGCPATIFLREVIAFPQYKLDPEKNTKHYRTEASKKLKGDMLSAGYTDLQYEKMIWIDLPKVDVHEGHNMGDASNLKAPIDQRVLDNTYQLIDEGFFNVNELKRNNNLFVKSLFGNKELPKAINRKFYPSREDFRQMVARRRRKIQHDLMDQELMDQKIKEWKAQYPADNWFFRPSAVSKEFAIEGEENHNEVFKSENQSFLLVFQSQFQKHLLERYGQELVFLDATYKTMKYAIPLFFLCVHTNCGYAVVGTFLIENEDAKSLAEALQIFQEMNPSWTTKAFMVDASEIEATAITSTYPNVKIFLCDFHRKQAWIRWLSSIKHGVSSQKDEILALLNAVAESSSDEDFKSNLSSLKESSVWKENPNLQDYIQRQWLSDGMVEKWVWFYRSKSMSIVINTNNGVEAQNHVFKQEYLAPYRTKTLSGLMTILHQEFFTDAHRKYLEANVSSSEGWRTGSSNIPEELHHKPKHLLSHIRMIMVKAANIEQDTIKQVDNNTYEIKSSNRKDTYTLELKNNLDMPFCSCFQFRKTHLLCKHFAAVFNVFGHNWCSLPISYTSIPIFNLDEDCITINADVPRSGSVDNLVSDVVSDEEHVFNDTNLAYVKEETHPSLTVLQKKLREELSKINTLSYIIRDQKVIEEQTIKLKDITNVLREVCPEKEGLLLEPEPSLKKGPLKNVPGKKILRGLPLRKKRLSQKKALHQISTDGPLQSSSKKATCMKRKFQASTDKIDSGIPEKKKRFTKTGLDKQQKEEQKLEEIEIKPLMNEYMNKLGDHDWENIIAKGNYVGTGLPGRRAGAALEMVKEDAGQLLKHVKDSIPKKFHVSDLCLVEILFVLMARMVNDEIIKLKIDPKDTDKKAQEAMKELLQCLKESKQSSDVPRCIKNSLCAKECEENFIEKLKEEGILKSSTYMLTKNSSVRYEVQGETLEGKDLRTLQGSRWLNDKVMNAYMSVLKEENNREHADHIFVLPSYMAVLWEQNRFDTWFYRRVSFSQYTWVFQPINKNQNHWILLAAHVPDMSVSILDSLAGSNDNYIANWRKYMKLRSTEVGELPGEWTNGNIQSSRQKDGNSCGPFVLMNALALSKGIQPSALSQKSALVMRQHVTCKLIEAAKKPKAQRTICDMLDCKQPNKDSWVQCEVCGRWLHFRCVGLKVAPVNDYVCIICNAQYQ